MLSDINSKREQLWHRFQDKESRDNWSASHLGTSLSAQIFSLREDRDWTQRELADMVGMAQSRISLLEDPDYERFTVATLKRLASAFDVAFVGRFVPFSEMLEWATDMTPERLAPREFKRDIPPWDRHVPPREAQTVSRVQEEDRRRRKTAAHAYGDVSGVFARLNDPAPGTYGHFNPYGLSLKGGDFSTAFESQACQGQ
jgi:transcriptional regulator with XRE-family HTH domain